MSRDPRRKKALGMLGTTLLVGGAVGGFVAADGGGAVRGFLVASLLDGRVMAEAPQRAAAPYLRAMGMEGDQSWKTGGTR
jgi:hypothetical protein